MAATESVIRAVVTDQDAETPNNGLPNAADDYKTRLLKLIPAETVAFYTGLAGVPEALKEQSPGWYVPTLVLLILAGLVGTPLILTKAYGMTWRYKKGQILLSMAAYILWVASIGTFQGFVPIPSVVMTIVLGVFTFLVAPFVNPGNNTSSVG
jgi:hypothetical protein